jgi:glycine/D-amino acid oxidase-like deaminating enzyme/nitrite reductase/ring-hydroxylating ferredoxin subunit
VHPDTTRRGLPGLPTQTTSYWNDSAATPEFPRPKRNIDVDVVVVGGGIAGITAAYLFKKAGATVALIERGRFARVDTGHTTAHLTSVTDSRLHHLRRKFGGAVAKSVWDAGAAAIDQIAALVRDENIACDFNWVPGYLHAPVGDPSAKAVRELKREAAVAAEIGIRAEYLPKVPLFGVPGVRFQNQALFHPVKYLAALLSRIPGKGCHVFENSAVEEILERPLAAKVGELRIRGRFLFLATHNPLMGNTPMASAFLFQTKLSLYSSYALGARLPAGSSLPGSWWDTADPYHYLRIEKRRGFDYAIFGGEDHKTGQEPDTDGAYRRLERTFLSLFPKAAIDHRWSGQVIETNDGLPYIGESAPHQFVATGFSGNGMTFGTLGAMMACDAMARRANPWAELFAVHRKKVFGGTWNYLSENVDYPYYLVRNWLAKAEGKSLRSVRPGQGKILSLDGKKVAVHRSASGALSLCSPVCTHLQCIVDWNRSEQTWDCPCHGSRFKPTGEVISGPAEEPLERIPLPEA